MTESDNVRWILYCSVGDVNWRSALERLTDDELRYCLQRETRRSSRQRLEAVARKRGLQLEQGALQA